MIMVETLKDRKTDGERQRQVNRETERQRQGERRRETETETGKQRYRETWRETGREIRIKVVVLRVWRGGPCCWSDIWVSWESIKVVTVMLLEKSLPNPSLDVGGIKSEAYSFRKEINQMQGDGFFCFVFAFLHLQSLFFRCVLASQEDVCQSVRPLS